MKDNTIDKVEVAKKMLSLHTVGRTSNWKFGLVTREVYKSDKDVYVISDTSGSWLEAVVNSQEMIQLYTGDLDLLMLEWK